MVIWFDRAPTWLAFVLIIAIANAVAMVAMLLARRWSHRIGVTTAPTVVGAWETCARGLTALLFAFTIVTVWNSAARAKSNVDDEAAAVRQIARDVAPAQLPLLRRGYHGAAARGQTAIPGHETYIVLMVTVATAIGPGELIDIVRAHLVS